MKTTIEIPDALFRKAKSKAAERGQTLKELVTEALQEKLGSDEPDILRFRVGEYPGQFRFIETVHPRE